MNEFEAGGENRARMNGECKGVFTSIGAVWSENTRERDTGSKRERERERERERDRKLADLSGAGCLVTRHKSREICFMLARANREL